MQSARALDLVQFLANLRHPIANLSPVRFDLGLARTTEEPETAALPFEVGPAAHQPSCLVIEMRQLDLKPTLGGCGALAEDFEDQSGAVDHLALELFLEIALLDRTQRAIDDHQFGVFEVAGIGDPLNLALAEQCRRADSPDRNRDCLGDHDPDGHGQPARLLQAQLGIGGRAAHLGIDDDRARAAADFAAEVIGPEGGGQVASPPSFQSPDKSTCVVGWMVEIACL